MAGCSRALSEGHGTEPMKLSMSEAGHFILHDVPFPRPGHNAAGPGIFLADGSPRE
jgi:hypothetical protein